MVYQFKMLFVVSHDLKFLFSRNLTEFGKFSICRYCILFAWSACTFNTSFLPYFNYFSRLVPTLIGIFLPSMASLHDSVILLLIFCQFGLSACVTTFSFIFFKFVFPSSLFLIVFVEFFVSWYFISWHYYDVVSACDCASIWSCVLICYCKVFSDFYGFFLISLGQCLSPWIL